MNEPRITYLFYRHFEGSSTPEEKQELAELMQDPIHKEDIMDLMEKAWQSYSHIDPVFSEEKSKQLLDTVLNHQIPEETDFSGVQIPKLSFWKSIVAAAMVLIISGFAFYFHNQSVYEISETVENDILPGVNKASLALGNDKLILLEDAPNGIVAKHKGASVIKVIDGHISYQSENQRFTDTPTFHQLQTTRGGQYKLTLPDGSKVWLNAASSIKFPVQFSEEARKIEVTGEVYLEVNKSLRKNGQLRPFWVKANDTEIEVLGTQFNINAYKEGDQTRTTLVEGSVKVRKGNSEELLQPGQEALVSGTSGTIQVLEVDTDLVIAWKNGYFQFDQTPLKDVMQQLSNWYDVDIVYEGAIPNRSFSGEISRNTTLSQVLEILSISKIHFNQTDKKIIIKP